MNHAVLQVLVNTIVAAAHCSLVAVGFSLIYRSGRFFHFSHAAAYTGGAYTALVATAVGASPWIGLAVATIASGALGAGLEYGIYATLRRRGANPQGLLVASLGVLVLAESAFSLIFGTQVKSLTWGWATRPVSLALGVRFTFLQIVVVVAAVAMTALLVWLLHYSRNGLVLRAMWSDAELTRIHGANVNRAILMAFIVGSSLAGVAGVLWGYNTALTPLMGFRALLFGAVATIVGGTRGLNGAIVGSVTVAAVQQAVLWWFPGEWEDVGVFMVLLSVLVARSLARPGKAMLMRG